MEIYNYKVTTELKTSWWLKLLRFCRIKDKRTDFYLNLSNDIFEENDIITTGKGIDLKVLEKLKNK